MMKRRKATLVIIIVMIFASSLLAENNKFGISFTAGYSIIYSQNNPQNISSDFKKYYNSTNFGVILRYDKHLINFNYKQFDVNPNGLTSDVSNEITGKDFFDFTLTYGRNIYSVKSFNLNAFVGIGFIQRKTNREKAGPAFSENDEFITFPIKLTLNRMIYKKIGLSASIFSEPNFVESVSGFDLNLFIQFK